MKNDLIIKLAFCLNKIRYFEYLFKNNQDKKKLRLK